MDLEVLLSQMFDNGPDLIEGGARAAFGQGARSMGLGPGVDYLNQTADQLFQPMSFEDDEEDRLRKAKITELFAARDAEAAAGQEQAAGQGDLQKLIEAGKVASGQREFMEGTTPLVEDYEKGIAIGGDPSRGTNDEIIARIRAQAAQMAGRDGPSAGGGGFSQGSLSPAEDAARIYSLEKFAGGQDVRDAQWSRDLATQRGDTQGASTAAEMLSGAKRDAVMADQQRIQNTLINKLGDNSGKIPYEQSIQLETAGVQLPYGVRGMSPDEFEASINGVISGTQIDLDTAIAAQQNFTAPPEATTSVINYSRYIQDRVRQIKSMVDAGKMTRDEAVIIIQDLIQSEAQASGALKASQAFMIEQGQPVQAGE